MQNNPINIWQLLNVPLSTITHRDFTHSVKYSISASAKLIDIFGVVGVLNNIFQFPDTTFNFTDFGLTLSPLF